MKEKGYSRAHAYRLADKIIGEMLAMGYKEKADNDRQDFLVRKKIRKEWNDNLQKSVSFET